MFSWQSLEYLPIAEELSDGMILLNILKTEIMSANSQERKKTYDKHDKELTDLQKKYKVDMQEVLNAVISADNNLQEAEEYLKKRTEKK